MARKLACSLRRKLKPGSVGDERGRGDQAGLHKREGFVVHTLVGAEIIRIDDDEHCA